jgi:outer membrane protein OmpA-like peptidoglycan-associated protein
MQLSQRRAKATIDWLVKMVLIQSINRQRINTTVNKCADNVTCSEEEHQLNRSEFIIIDL